MQRGQKVDIFGKARVNVRLSDVWRARFNYHDGHFDFFFFSRPMYKYNIFLPKIDLDICWSGNVAGISAHADSRLGPVSGGEFARRCCIRLADWSLPASNGESALSLTSSHRRIVPFLSFID